MCGPLSTLDTLDRLERGQSQRVPSPPSRAHWTRCTATVGRHLAPHAFPLCALTAHEPAPRTPRRHRRSPRSRRRRQERCSPCPRTAARFSRPTSWRMPRPARDSLLMKPPSVEGFPIHLSRRGLELGGCLRIRTNDDDSAGLTPAPRRLRVCRSSYSYIYPYLRRQIALFGRDHALPTLFGGECAAAGGVCARGRFLLIDM